MHKKNTCKCGSSKVVYVVQKGRSKSLEAYCERCLPVENDEEEKYLKSAERAKKN